MLSNIYKREHYVLKNNEYLNTDIFDDIIKKSNKEDEQKKITKKKKPVIWKQLRDNIDDHTTQMFKWRSDQKYRQRNSINNMINKVKQKYNDNLCQRYVKFYNFNYRDARMISPRIAELRPFIDINTGKYSESLKQCVHDNPEYTNKFECPKSIICPNRRRSSNPIHKLKNYNHVCEYTCI